ncbi:nuclear transport factor 2 family protein [Sphingomonas sp. RT2P30]|uniref:nuclear transport factor 2 family protein n=1 Tax=Parasphingomonas halimpatiens TaxID=3096162 RepID=UPI002FCC7EE8
MAISLEAIEARLQRVEAELAITALVHAYSFAMDNRDLASALDLFTEDGRFRSADGVMDAHGHDAIAAQYRGRYAALGFNLHVTHDRTLAFEGPDDATGMVSGHAELVRHGETMVAAMRYHDRYRRGADGRWRFADRCLHFFYYLPVTDYVAALKRRDRMRAYGEPRDAELPEGAWR